MRTSISACICGALASCVAALGRGVRDVERPGEILSQLGVPVRIELGPRDLAANMATVARRLSGGKAPAALDGLADEVVALLAAEQQAMLGDARTQRDVRIADVDSVEDAAAAATDGWARISWARLGVEGEERLAQSALTVRCLQRPDGSLPESEDEPDLIALVARSY